MPLTCGVGDVWGLEADIREEKTRSRDGTLTRTGKYSHEMFVYPSDLFNVAGTTAVFK